MIVFLRRISNALIPTFSSAWIKFCQFPIHLRSINSVLYFMSVVAIVTQNPAACFLCHTRACSSSRWEVALSKEDNESDFIGSSDPGSGVDICCRFCRVREMEPFCYEYISGRRIVAFDVGICCTLCTFEKK